MTNMATAAERRAAIRRLRTGLFGSTLNSAITIIVLALAIRIAIPLWHWAVSDAIWSGSTEDCRADGAGACWVFIAVKFRFLVFGFYPPSLQWRPALALGLLAGMLILSGRPRVWGLRLVVLWLASLVAVCVLMNGSFSSQPVPDSQWSGLPITLLVSLAGLLFALPIAILLALARQSSMGIVRTLAVLFIEGVRGVPLIAVLYIAMLIVPMALPADMPLDKLLRAQIGITLFASAYLAEVIRAGLQSVHKAQWEAAASLGMHYWQTARLVILPQAFRAVIPAIVNLSIGILLNTSLLAVIGINDLLSTAKIAATDPQWLGFYTEGFAFAAVVYFAISFGASRYSLWLERRLAASS